MRPFRLYLLLLTLATALVAVPRPPFTEPGLPPLRSLLPHVAEVPQRPRVLGYERAEFGPGWAPSSGCTVREQLLIDAGGLPRHCRIVGGHGFDPYTGETIDLAADVEIDHIYPLSAAWDLGAHRWSRQQRVAFANDPRNLVVTSRGANQEKSDLLPGQWRPAEKRSRCWYSRRLALVAATYDLPLPVTDIVSMTRACRMDDLTAHWLGWSVDL